MYAWVDDIHIKSETESISRENDNMRDPILHIWDQVHSISRGFKRDLINNTIVSHRMCMAVKNYIWE